jgi:ADP-heptose:LPS heptosyltransferase
MGKINDMKKVCLDLSECRALGDNIAATPILRKLYKSYNQKITVISNFREIFGNNPYVEKIYNPDSINIEYMKENYNYHNTFYNLGKKDQFGIETKHNTIDIRQYHAIKLGMMLGNDELEYDYIPDPYENLENLPSKYVLIHPVQTWPSRTWSAENWITLTSLLNKRGISVVSIGKDSSETGFFNVQKPIFNFEIENGLNLMNKTTISQAWHLINNSVAFITMDSGLLHLAGTTDTEIIMLGSSIRPEFRLPYRKNSQSYKQYYIAGNCRLSCASDVKYGVKEWDSIQGVPPLIGCLENKPAFECHPAVHSVLHKIENILEENGK